MVPLCPAFMGGVPPVLYRLVCTGPPCSKWSNLWSPPKISLILVKPQQSLSLLTGVLSKNQKKTKCSLSLSNISFILTTSKLEAILENHRCSLKLVQSGMSVGGGGEGSPLNLLPPVWRAGTTGCRRLRYARRVAPFHCPISVSFSFSTFFCFAASWTEVDEIFALSVQNRF
jgi:hypothetical protein